MSLDNPLRSREVIRQNIRDEPRNGFTTAMYQRACCHYSTHWNTTLETKGVHDSRKSASMKSVYSWASVKSCNMLFAGENRPQTQL